MLTEDADGDSDLRHQRTVVSINTVPPQRQKSEMSSLSGFTRLLSLNRFVRDRSDRSDCGPQIEQSGSLPTLELRSRLSSHPGAGGQLWSCKPAWWLSPEKRTVLPHAGLSGLPETRPAGTAGLQQRLCDGGGERDRAFRSASALALHGSLQSKQRDATGRGKLPASCAEMDCCTAVS